MNLKNEKATLAVRELAKQVKPRYYPAFHLTAPAGWINDPNGLIYINGTYHAFYQHYPFSEERGPMHWGHATSKDLVHWYHQPIALCPGDEFDRDGCFSGSAVDDNGVLTLIYTGHNIVKDDGNEKIISQVQCIATSHDGVHFKKEGIVLTAPEGIMHFRDPKVWQENGIWKMVIGVRDLNDIGQVYLYKSCDLRSWQFEQILAKANELQGYMWECPDYIKIQNKSLLVISPQGIKPDRFSFNNRYQSGYFLGHEIIVENQTRFVIEQDFIEMDLGHDFYAPQSFYGTGERKIIMAWLDMWLCPMPEKEDKWAGCFSLPREITLTEQGKIKINPIKELVKLRDQLITIQNIQLNSKELDTSIESNQCEIQLELFLPKNDAERYGLIISRSLDKKEGLLLYIDNQSKRLVLDRSYSGKAMRGVRSLDISTQDKLKLHIFIDRSSIEVFVNDGDFSLSSRFYPSSEYRFITFFAENGSAHFEQFNCWQLKSSWNL